MDDISPFFIDFLNSTSSGPNVLIKYEEVDLLKTYKPIVDKFININPPLTSFEEPLNDEELYLVLQDLCWLLIYDMIPKKFKDHDFLLIHRSVKEDFTMNFSQQDKKIANSTIIFSGKFMELWCIIICASIISFFLYVFPDSDFCNNVPFVSHIEKYVNNVIAGSLPPNMKYFHKSVFGLIPDEIKSSFPALITVDGESPFNSPQQGTIIRNRSEKKEAQIHVPQNSKPAQKKCHPYERSGVPIARAREVFKKTDNIINNYRIDRQKALFDICAQEELYIEAKDEPPITPLGITFEDFPKPHLPPDYYNPRAPRRRFEKRPKSVKKPKNMMKRRYRVIPEPEETMERIAIAHEYLTEHPVYLC